MSYWDTLSKPRHDFTLNRGNQLKIDLWGSPVAHNVWFHVAISIGQGHLWEGQKVQELAGRNRRRKGD